MHYLTLEYEDDGGIAVVTMNRPEKRNALSLDVMRELVRAFESVAQSAAYAAILRGEGAAFSAGHDLQELQCGTAVSNGDVDRFREIFDVCVTLMQTIQTIPQPVIAEVATIATAAGCQLVATCDLAVASEVARFATPGVRIGLFCTTPMVALTRAVGRKRAMEMLLTGEFIDATAALEWGLVNRIVPLERLHEAAVDLAKKIGQASRTVVALGKRAFYAQIELDQRAAYAYAKETMTENAAAADAQEGMAAFIQKRSPHWKNS